MFAQIRKAIVPLAVAAALAGLSIIGVLPTPDVVNVVTLVVTAVLVYFIPNDPR
jgi:hypothetical protein